jgi:hypothetical protein
MKLPVTFGALFFVSALALPVQASPIAACEISAAAKKHQKQPARLAMPPSRGWRPADPSFDQQGRLYKPPRGWIAPSTLATAAGAPATSTTDGTTKRPEKEKAGPFGPAFA